MEQQKKWKEKKNDRNDIVSNWIVLFFRSKYSNSSSSMRNFRFNQIEPLTGQNDGRITPGDYIVLFDQFRFKQKCVCVCVFCGPLRCPHHPPKMVERCHQICIHRIRYDFGLVHSQRTQLSSIITIIASNNNFAWNILNRLQSDYNTIFVLGFTWLSVEKDDQQKKMSFTHFQIEWHRI